MTRGAQIAIVVLIVALCGCLVVGALAAVVWANLLKPQVVTWAPPSPTAERVYTPKPLGTSTPEPSLTATPDSGTRHDSTVLTTEERLFSAEMPQRDIRLLAERLRKVGPIPEVVRQSPAVYQLGEVQEFWVGNVDTMEQHRIKAVVRYETPHLYMWVEEGLQYSQQALVRSAKEFEDKTYPRTREFFGSEWLPGVDGDPHLHVLHSTSERMGSGVAGYYSSADEYSYLANAYSNEREIFYVSLTGMQPGTDFYDGVLAHEFQHMIHWANDRNEETWVNEGCSELAAYLTGHDPGGFDWLFVSDPDVQLTTWPEGGSAAANYGSSYLFVTYFMGRFGRDVLKRVIADPANGIAGFDNVLADYGLTFEDVFSDWLVANYVDNTATPALRDHPEFVYPDHVVGPVSFDATHDTYPVRREAEVHQFAADYVSLAGKGDLAIEFQGDVQARLVPVEAHSGRYAWWSNRGDDSDATLTRAFDLRGLDRATLLAWMWYDIESDWDYAYVEVSADHGETWDLLAGPGSTERNPNGNSFGQAYTGRSDGWVEERFDLDPYVGNEVLVRFEYVTDDAVNRAGWLIDDVRVLELEYENDFEAGPGDWLAEGFVYSDNVVSQHYQVQLITLGRELNVIEMSLDQEQRGVLELRGLGTDIDSAVLVISATAPVTTERAEYQYSVLPLD